MQVSYHSHFINFAFGFHIMLGANSSASDIYFSYNESKYMFDKNQEN